MFCTRISGTMGLWAGAGFTKTASTMTPKHLNRYPAVRLLSFENRLKI